MSPPTRSLLFLTFLYSVALQCNGHPLDPPLECDQAECAPYRVVHSDDEFDIRQYESALWVSSPVINESSYLFGFGKGYSLLDDYYGGKNDRNVTIEQTYPMEVDVGEYVHNLTYTVYFYVPKKYRHGLPAPVSPEIKPVRLPRRKYVAVRRFFDDDDSYTQIPEQLDALKKSLEGTPYRRAASSNAFTILFYEGDNNVVEIVLSFD